MVRQVTTVAVRRIRATIVVIVVVIVMVVIFIVIFIIVVVVVFCRKISKSSLVMRIQMRRQNVVVGIPCSQ